MSSAPRAVIDIGTNSVKLLVGIVSGQNVQALVEKSDQTRLGKGFYETRQLQSDAIQKTAEAVGAFADEARTRFLLSSLRIIATSAARDALNKQQLLDAIYRTCGVPVEVISGDQEADWVFEGVTSDPMFASKPLLVIDVGGGSTEFIAGQGAEKKYRHSFEMGTVRLLEKLRPADPPTAQDWTHCREILGKFAREEVAPEISRALQPESRLVGTGGSATILARIKFALRSFERDKIEGTTVALSELMEIRQRLWSIPIVERKHIIGLPSKRADVILTGVAIYLAIMEALHFERVHISTRGLRYAALLDSERSEFKIS